MKYTYFLFLLTLPFLANGQGLTYEAEINTAGFVSSQDELPFWMHTNKRGRVDQETNVSGWGNLWATYALSENSFLRAGAGLLYYDGYHDELKLDESFLQYRKDWFEVIVGRKQRELLYEGLSATNHNILWSLNARPLPGIQLRTTKPIIVFVDEGIGFQAALEDYWLGNNRVVKGARLHHKSFHITVDPIKTFSLRLGMHHFAQWGGTSPEYGKMPGGIDDYFRIFTGQGGGSDAEEGDQQNALGNHLGSYEVNMTIFVKGHEVEFIYNHMFEDGSGSRFRNTPDGRYGLFFRDKNQEKRVNTLMYEFYYTRNQSKNSSTTDGTDNYFQHMIYESDYTYEGFVLGVPFILFDRENNNITQNRIMVHHVGVAGNVVKGMPFKLLTSYRKYYGAKGITNYQFDVLSSNLNLLVYQKLFDVRLMMGADIFSDRSPNFGAGIHLRKKIF